MITECLNCSQSDLRFSNGVVSSYEDIETGESIDVVAPDPVVQCLRCKRYNMFNTGEKILYCEIDDSSLQFVDDISLVDGSNLLHVEVIRMGEHIYYQVQ